LKIDVTPHEDHQVKIVAEFEPSEFEEYKIRAAKKLGRNTRIPGFRPGKAPLEMIRRVIGEEAIVEQALEDLVDEQYPKILDQAEVKPGGPGSLEEVASLEPPKLTFLVPLEPEVKLGNYKEIRLPYEVEPVTDEEVEDFLKDMRTRYGTAEPVERPAAEGDLVYVTLSGVLTQPAEGEDAEVFPPRPAQFIIGTDVIENRDWPFPGFNDHLRGLSAGDEKTFTHTFPEDEKDEALRGKEVEFKVVVQSVKAVHLPELDDAFAQTVGEFDTMDDLRKAVVEQLERAKKEAADDKFFIELLDKLVAESEIKYPSQVLEHEVEHLLEHLKEDLARQGLELETYFKIIGTDREKYIEEQARPAARKRLERALVIEEVGRVENIQLAKEDYDKAISATISQLQSMPAPQKRKERISRDLVNSAAASALTQRYNQLILERLKRIATGQAEQIESQASAEGESAAAMSVENKAEAESAESSDKTDPGSLPEEEA
jgi:trigger factor